jgi:hypothetical protein
MSTTTENQTPTTPTIPFLIDSKELATLVGVRPATCAQWRFRKTGPPYITLQTGDAARTVRYELSEVTKWVQNQKQPTTTTTPHDPTTVPNE